MTPGLFDQFLTPSLMGVPLIALAIILPWIMLPSPTAQWVHNRLLALQESFIKLSTQQLLLPMSTSGHKWAALLTSLLLFLITTNMLGLLPYTFTPTTQLSINLGLAAPLWLATVILGLRGQPTRALGHLLPEGTPTPLIPALVIIETISLLIRPLALGVRLTANLTAGHLLIQLISTAAFVLLYSAPVVSVMASTMLLLLTTLEVAVAMIQAYVFVLLLTLYIQENI